jgi:flagellar FliL protein
MANPTDSAPRARGKKLPLLAGATLLALGGAGVVAFGLKEDEQAAASAVRPERDPAVIRVDPFVVNLSDPEGERYLRCTLRLVLDRQEAAAQANADPLLQARLRDRIFSLLASTRAGELASLTGRDAMRARIRETVGPLFGEAVVLEVYFTEFLLQ